MGEWGEGSNVFWLIHVEVGADANLLFWNGEARPIDFDGSGFGQLVYDLRADLASETKGHRDAGSEALENDGS